MWQMLSQVVYMPDIEEAYYQRCSLATYKKLSWDQSKWQQMKSIYTQVS